ncbi:MAG TPA: GAF domain-containing sensor histidine kinase [Terriglobales bacterium]|jgi:signal transduction histidine kinase
MLASSSENHAPVGLDSIISTLMLSGRRTRAPNHVAENDALIALAEKLATSPDGILQMLAERALNLCQAQTCGISLLGTDGTHFYWPALTGVWASHVGGSMPRGFSPCGTVLDRNAAQLMSHPERHFAYFAAVTPWIEEVLLVPFYVGGKAVGTIWVIIHDQSHRFDSEDLRIMTNLGIFAAAAYQTLQYLKSAKLANEHLESEVQRRTGALQQLSTKLMRLQDEERRRIARNLHDSLGQDLTNIKMTLESLRRSDANKDEALSSAMESVERSIVETRTLSFLLHPPLIDEVGFASAARWFIDQFGKRSGIKVKLDLPDEMQRLPELAEIALFRILQESLTNVHRHSGSSAVEVRLQVSEHQAVFTVRDFGRGLPAELSQGSQTNGNHLGVGLSGMRERVNDLNGNFEIQSGGDGTAIVISIPLTTKCVQP